METNPAIRREITAFMDGLRKRNKGETEFQWAVREVMEALSPFTAEHTQYRDAYILERMTEQRASSRS